MQLCDRAFPDRAEYQNHQNRVHGELQSLEIFKILFFDGLTKDVFFNTINKVHSSIEIARIKTGLLRDSVFSSDGSLENEKDSWK